MTVKLLTEHNLEFLNLSGGGVYDCQNATFLEITSHGSIFLKKLILKKVRRRQQKHEKLPRMQRVHMQINVGCFKDLLYYVYITSHRIAN